MNPTQPWWARAALSLGRMAKDWLTAVDGETWAVGRAAGLFVLLFGLAMPTAGWIQVTRAGEGPPTVADLIAFVGAMVAYLPALAGAVAMLIGLTNHTEPRPPAPPALREDPSDVG